MTSPQLTQAMVDKLSSETRTAIADGACKGLSIDVRPAGRTYRFRYTDRSGAARSVIIGDASLLKLAEARQIARELARRHILGEDIQHKKPGPPPPVPMTFGEFVAQRYLPHAQLTKRGIVAELSLMRTHILPAFQERPLTEVTKGEVTAFIHAKLPAGYAPGTINRMLNLLKAVFSAAIGWELPGLTINPARGIKELPVGPGRERFLSSEEAGRLLAAVMASDNAMLGPIIAFLLLTGARKREALDARWDSVNVATGLWTIPLSKSGQARHLPLSPRVVSTLALARAVAQREMGEAAARCRPYIFPNPLTGKPFVSIYTSWHSARCKAGLVDVRVHDLRHSFASALVNQGMTLYDVKQLLGHANIATTQRYAHLSPGRLQTAVNAAGHFFETGLAKSLPVVGAGPQDPERPE
jgi:integrase